MSSRWIHATALALLTCPVLSAANPQEDIQALEQRIKQIDTRLESLATFSMQTSVGAIGFRSVAYPSSDHTEWIRIDFENEMEIDLVVLVPAIWRETSSGFVADGFPLEFEILAGSAEHPEGERIARFTEEDGLLPRVAPLSIPCAGTRASWIKLEATRLSTRAWDGAHLLQLSEILVFSGQDNIALKQQVTTSSDQAEPEFGARRKSFLVDGSLPYLMHAAVGDPSQAYLAEIEEGKEASFIADLGTPTPINRLHLHALEVADTVPQANRSDFGFPHRFTLEGADQEDFSDASTLCSFEKSSIYDAAPITQIPFQETTCRYLRLIVQQADHARPMEFNSQAEFIGIAEIEVFSQGSNILLNQRLVPGFVPVNAERPLEDLTDGRNIFGNILPIRTWMEQLALRHDLEIERPRVAAQLGALFGRQKLHLEFLKWISAALGVGILIMILIGRNRRMRTVAQLQRRFAADLHDEIGANLHAVGLLSDIAAEQISSTSDDPSLTETVTEIRAVTDRTADAVRYLADSQQPRRPLGTLKEDMHRIAARMMDETTYDISLSGQEHLTRLRPRQRADLFLFYKECLVNISRHSGATHFTADVKADANHLTLTIEDNGYGLPDTNPPPSLQRRAKILRARLKTESPLSSGDRGTRVTLTLRYPRFPFIP